MSVKICAVVVTYNRLNLLKECINSLRAQSRKLDEIIVVNNDSKDGTKEWLDSQQDLTKIHQENLGGAGGFHNGMKAAYEKGYDWIWCMDDDGNANSEALEILENSIQTHGIDVTGCLNLENSFSVTLPSNIHVPVEEDKFVLVTKVDEFIELADSENLIWNFVNTFNGVLISKEAIELIGYPKKEMFIWGDEVEYFQRMKKAKLRIATNIKAIFYHPKNPWKFKLGLFDKVLFTGDVNWRAYYFFRNRAYLSREDYRFFNLKFVLAQSWYYSKSFKLRSLFFFLNSYKDGIFGNFSKKPLK